MNMDPKDRQPIEPELDLPDTEEIDESALDKDDDFLDAFLADDYDDDDSTKEFGFPRFSDMDSDAEFDRYFRNADSHHRGRERRRRRRDRSWEDNFDFGALDDRRGESHRSRRPRR